MKKQRKIKGGLKNKGLRNAPWDKLNQEGAYDSAKKAPHDQLKGGAAKPLAKKEK